MRYRGNADAIANRPDERAEEIAEEGRRRDGLADTAEPEGQFPTEVVKGGDQSSRAAVSGATGERHPGGGRNKPEPKDPDQKAQAGSRNRRRAR